MGRITWTSIVLLMACFFPFTSAQAAGLSTAEAINKAAWQRTLTQRIAKNYMLVGGHVDLESSTAQLKASISEFEMTLFQLQNNAPNDRITKTTLKLKKKWIPYKEVASSKPTKDSALWLIEESNSLLALSDKLVQQWLALDHTNLTHLVDLSNHQSMLSERIGMYYSAHFFGVQEDWVITELNLSLKAFSAGMDELYSTDTAPSEMLQSLSSIENQWEYVKHGLVQFNKGQYVPLIITVTMESMLDNMSQMANIYTAMATPATDFQPSINIPGLASNVSAY